MFHQEFSLVVSSSSVNFQGTRAYIQKYVKELMPRGNDSNTRVLLLSGSHGFKDGRDALCSLDGLTSLNDGMPNQTRYFYEEWCDFFRLDVEGEDPRVYDENKKVVGVKDDGAPKWGERVPWLPGIWRRNLVTGEEQSKDLELKIKIIDVS